MRREALGHVAVIMGEVQVTDVLAVLEIVLVMDRVHYLQQGRQCRPEAPGGDDARQYSVQLGLSNGIAIRHPIAVDQINDAVAFVEALCADPGRDAVQLHRQVRIQFGNAFIALRHVDVCREGIVCADRSQKGQNEQQHSHSRSPFGEVVAGFYLHRRVKVICFEVRWQLFPPQIEISSPMNLNDVLRRIRYTFDFNDTQMIEVFAGADHAVSREQVCAWLKQEEDEGFQGIADRDMALFLNGLINVRRGRREGPAAVPEAHLTNNMVLMKLRIALNLQSEDVQDVLAETGLNFSNHELTALFRKPGHKHYRHCEDQLLRNFLKGLQARLRQVAETAPVAEAAAPAPHNVWGR